MQTKVYTKFKYNQRKRQDILKPLYRAYYVEWRTKWEMHIIRNSARIRSDPQWMEKLEDTNEVQTWIDMIKPQDQLTQGHLDYLVDELKYYAKLQRANIASRTMLSGVDMVWTIDIDPNDALAQEFRRHVVTPLEDIRYRQQHRSNPDNATHALFDASSDRSPGSNFKPICQTHHLINPSPYTLCFDTSFLLEHPTKSPLDALNLPEYGHKPGSQKAWKKAVCKLNRRLANDSSFIPINEEYISKLNSTDRHWLPADIYDNSDGSVDFKSYINNLHPGKYSNAYKSIAKVIARCVPALEQVLTDWKRPRNLRIPYNMVYRDSDPMPSPAVFSEPKRPLLPHSLRNKYLQVVVKLENQYVYTGSSCGYDKTHLDNNKWQGDGTASEQIIATAVYYYDVENLTDMTLMFQEVIENDHVRLPATCQQAIRLFEASHAFGYYTFEQAVGHVKIKPGLLVCYPNVYQHNIKCTYSTDSSRPSQIKALTLYFVDPSIRILSTSVIPPQQKDWWAEAVLQTPLMRKLPSLIQYQIIEKIDSPMPFEMASDIGKMLDERCHVHDNSSFFRGLVRKTF